LKDAARVMVSGSFSSSQYFKYPPLFLSTLSILVCNDPNLVQAVCFIDTTFSPLSSDRSWELLEDMRVVLEPFHKLTKVFQEINSSYVLFYTEFLQIVGFLYHLVEKNKLKTQKGKDYALSVVSQVFEYVKAGWCWKECTRNLAILPAGFDYVNTWWSACRFDKYPSGYLDGLRDPNTYEFPIGPGQLGLHMENVLRDECNDDLYLFREKEKSPCSSGCSCT
jgi:hypothetical protein